MIRVGAGVRGDDGDALQTGAIGVAELPRDEVRHEDALVGRVVFVDVRQGGGTGKHGGRVRRQDVGGHGIGRVAPPPAVTNLEGEAGIGVAVAVFGRLELKLAGDDVGDRNVETRPDAEPVEDERARSRRAGDPDGLQGVARVDVGEAEVGGREDMRGVLGHGERVVERGGRVAIDDVGERCGPSTSTRSVTGWRTALA